MFFGGLAYPFNPSSSNEHVLVFLGIEIYNPKFINKFKKYAKGTEEIQETINLEEDS